MGLCSNTWCTTTDASLGGRAATLKRLLRWLQLYSLADPSLLDDGLRFQLTAVVGGLQQGPPAVGSKRPSAPDNEQPKGKRAKAGQGASAASVHSGETADGETADSDGDEEEQGDALWEDQLVDVVLALLSYGGPAAEGSSLPGLPSAPLRDAVERVFKAHCRVLTAEGLTDLLRVVGQVRVWNDVVGVWVCGVWVCGVNGAFGFSNGRWSQAV